MSSATSAAPAAPVRGATAAEVSSGAADPRRWLALAVIATASLMVVLDTSIVNIALPHAQVGLRIPDADRQWEEPVV